MNVTFEIIKYPAFNTISVKVVHVDEEPMRENANETRGSSSFDIHLTCGSSRMDAIR